MKMQILPLALVLALSVAPGAAAAADENPGRTSHEAKARELYARSIAIATVRGNERVVEQAEYLAGEFRAAGFPADDIHVLAFKGTEDATASLVVRYRSRKPRAKPILLLAHMDVVAAKREDWERNPFELIEENGFFYGRGTIDNKAGMVAIVSTFLRLKAEGFVPTRDLIIYFSGDEETAQGTAMDVAKNHRALIDAEYALNSDGGGGVLDDDTGRPLYFQMQTAEKTYADFVLTTHNPGGHSSQPHPDNAIYDLAEALVRIRAYQFPVMWNDTTIASLRQQGSQRSGELGAALLRFADNPRDADAARIISAESSLVGQIRTTCVATLLAGGHAENALPQSASANINCRIFPGVKPDDVRQKLQELAGQAVEVTFKYDVMYSDASPLRPDIVAAVTRAVHAIRPGVPVVPLQSSGASDGLVFRAAGIPTYGIDGNFMRPRDDFAHGLNERNGVQSFYDSLKFWHTLITDLAGKRR